MRTRIGTKQGAELATPDEVFAQVRHLGLGRYEIVVVDGITIRGPMYGQVMLGWHRWGKKRAVRKGRQEVQRWLRVRSDITLVYGLSSTDFGASLVED